MHAHRCIEAVTNVSHTAALQPSVSLSPPCTEDKEPSAAQYLLYHAISIAYVYL